MDRLQQIPRRIREKAAGKSRLSGWVLPKQATSFAPDDGTWTNVDLDVTPPDRQTWTTSSILGYWLSDILSAQSWQIGASILAIGLTWREAVWTVLVGSVTMAFAIAFNGAPGAYLRVPFAIWMRSSFGHRGARFPVVVRMVTALFWHAIQTYSGSTAMAVLLTALWPSYAGLPNMLPAGAGTTSAGLLSHFLFWAVQLPFLTIPPHRLKWFFVLKAVVTITAAAGTAIYLCVAAGGSGDIWAARPAVPPGWTRSWLIVSTLTAQTGSWSTVGTNISDFTRYVRRPGRVYSQTVFFPLICFAIAFMGILGASASEVLYGEYMWDPLAITAKWTEDGASAVGRAAAVYCSLAWMTAQIGVNVSANVISASNDLASLFPKYLNIRRSAVLCTVVGGWVMVPWKIVTSAESLVNFMASLGIFLAPIIAISIADYWLVKRRLVDVEGLYQPHGRYRYRSGVNWRAFLALMVSVGPALPSLVQSVNPSLPIGGFEYLGDLVWYYGFLSAFVTYIAISKAFPAADSLFSHDEFTIQSLVMEEKTAIEKPRDEI